MQEFKVGDWVRDTTDGSVYKVSNIRQWENEPNYERVILFNTDDTWINIIDGEVEEGFELWKPEKGELCWFWKTNELPNGANLGQFREQRDNGEYVSESRHGFSVGSYWDFCEPFIGEVPSYLKEK